MESWRAAGWKVNDLLVDLLEDNPSAHSSDYYKAIRAIYDENLKVIYDGQPNQEALKMKNWLEGDYCVLHCPNVGLGDCAYVAYYQGDRLHQAYCTSFEAAMSMIEWHKKERTK